MTKHKFNKNLLKMAGYPLAIWQIGKLAIEVTGEADRGIVVGAVLAAAILLRESDNIEAYIEQPTASAAVPDDPVSQPATLESPELSESYPDATQPED